MSVPQSVVTLERDLRGIVGSRLQSLVVYATRQKPVRTLAVVDGLSHEDLRSAAARVDAWHDAGLATPLVIAAGEFDRSLDAFPFEFGAILADHVVAAGENPFAALSVDAADLRRACEVQARSHLLHLREGYIETRGRGDATSELIVHSAQAFAALVASIARLDGHRSDDAASAARHVERLIAWPSGPVAEVTALATRHDLPSADAERLIAPYLQAVEKIVAYVDAWSGRDQA